MEYGICNLSIIPCRKEANDKSEMVTQLLFGQTFSINTKTEKWAEIIIHDDHYRCWISNKQYKELSEEQFNYINQNSNYVVNDVISVMEDKHQHIHFPVIAGSLLPNYEEDNFEIVDHLYNYEGEVVNVSTKGTRERLVEKALEFLNTPYLWGGKSVLGIDCSGFTQLVYKLNGFNLLRDAYQQAESGKTLSFLDEAREGDLAFFDNEEGKIIHVGIILANHHIIHASGKVRIDKIDHFGIYNEEIKDYSHRLRILKNFIDS
jgi:hypothetical protein